MPINYAQIPHKGIQTLSPYTPGKPIAEVAKEFGLSDIIKLASNENALGCSPHVVDILHHLTTSAVAYYPAAHSHPLYEKLAQKSGVDTNQLIISNGSDVIFQHLLMSFALHTNRHLLTHDYAFITYQLQAQALGVPFYSSPLKSDWTVDVDKMIEQCSEKTGLICIANPNNPTGVLLESREVKRLLEHIPESTLLVLDEAYFEYAEPAYSINSVEWLSEHNNLVITRTFSKAYGLAGLRLGYAISNPDIIAVLQKIQLPFAVNQIALEAGVAALEDEHFIQNSLTMNKEGMHQMLQGLQTLGVTILPNPASNFITMDCQKDSMEIFQKLLKKGVIVRPLHSYNLPGHLRVTIGTFEQNARFLDALRDLI